MDVVHCPVGPGLVRGVGAPLVVTVHDVLPLERPEWFTRANVAQQRLALRSVLARAAAVVTPSAATAGAVRERFAVSPRVIPWGVDAGVLPRRARRRRPRAPGHRRAVSSSPSPRCSRARTSRPRSPPGSGCARRTASSSSARAAGATRRCAQRLGDDRVLAAGRVDDATLVALLRGADAMVHPSRHEGFGFPPLEAMACGTPVVAANATSLPEVVGDAGILSTSTTRPRWPGPSTTCSPTPPGGELRRRGLERAAGFTWARCAEATVAVYREALG